MANALLRSLWLIPAHQRTDEVPPRLKWFHMVAILGFGSLLVFGLFTRLLDYHWNWSGVLAYHKLFLSGWLMTLGIAVPALLLSCLLGGLIAIAQQSCVLPLRYGAKLYVVIVRGSPLLVQIYLLYYAVFDIFGLTNAWLAGVMILSLFSAAYVAEIFRAGLEGVSKSQRESGLAVGFTRLQLYRYVILPQALRQTLPPLAGQAASLIKDSSLLSIIAINELTLNAQEVASVTLSPFESYLPLAIGYLILTIPVTQWSRMLERRAFYET